MKIKLTRKFSYQLSPTKVISHERGETVDLPERYAIAALRQRAGVRVGAAKKEPNPKKGAPENKVRTGGENKAGVGKKTKRSRSTGSKS